MDQIADTTKMLTAYKIINQQLASENQKKRQELRLHEERFNYANEMLLRERQENKALRDMVRKLKDQMQLVTKVVLSVQEQTSIVFERINRPHEEAERLMKEYTPRAHRVYEQRRLEIPPYVNEHSIPEGNESDEEAIEKSEEDSTNIAEAEASVKQQEKSGAAGGGDTLDETCTSVLSRESRSNGGGLVQAIDSPLVQRLKRASKNASFDESFESIDRERAFKLSRSSQNSRRQIYANIQDNITDLQSIGAASQMDVDEQLSDTLRNLSPLAIDKDEDEGMLSDKDEDEEMPSALPTESTRQGKSPPALLKKAISESVLSKRHPSRTINEQDDHSKNSSVSSQGEAEEELTVFNPAEFGASCSTPVAKNSVIEATNMADPPLALRGGRGRGRSRGRGRGRPSKDISEPDLLTAMNPVVVLQPLTERNVKALERQQPARRAKPTGPMKEHDCSGWSNAYDGSSMGDPCSSTENMSVLSTDSSRPRRRAAPKSLREPTLQAKLRRP
ncbi:AGAP005407-PA [Anopheles gambiae str. PEST]|uniref:AGAP005407-PA n=1 Tax=Anopheles gambiae TaxID=7165 RepID=Q5TRS8_ANOGA|nr:AGAP005407-PA [Anopheles gambiae str. PEST]